MNIKPTNTPGPKYPVLATIAVAAALTAPACQQQQQRPLQPTAGAPLPPPSMQSSAAPKPQAPKEAQRTPGTFAPGAYEKWKNQQGNSKS